MAVPGDRWDWEKRVDSGKFKLSGETAERMGHFGGLFGDRGATTRPLPTGVWQARQVPIVRIPFRMEQFCGWFCRTVSQ